MGVGVGVELCGSHVGRQNWQEIIGLNCILMFNANLRRIS